MADNVVLNPGVGGDTIAADDIAGAKHQQVKIELGADGSATGVSGNSGNKDAGTVRVVVATDQPALTTPMPVATPTDPFGANADAAVSAGATGSLSAKLRAISRDIVANIVLAAGSARIGKVTLRNAADAADIDPLAEATFTGRIGEVQASPTAHTLLARLKSIEDKLDATLDVNVTNAAFAASKVVSTAFENSKQGKASAGTLFGFTVANKDAATHYVALYDAASKIGTPVNRWPVYSNEVLSVSFADGIGLPMATGIFLQGKQNHGPTTMPRDHPPWYLSPEHESPVQATRHRQQP